MKKLIITHPGGAHFDEFFAVSLILAVHPDTDFTIVRREPIQEELDNPAVWVVDVGDRYEPALKNFDHHQDIDLNASFVLVARYLNLDRRLQDMPWWTFKDRIDRFGPFRVGAELGVKSLLPSYSPVETWLLKRFEQSPLELYPLMRSFGQHILEEADHLKAQFDFWDQCEKVTLNGRIVMIGLTTDSDGAEWYSAQMETPASIVITHDSRRSGWRLARIRDAEGVDFSKLEGHDCILFAHKTGFMAKTKEQLPIDEVLKLISLALD
ncbi:MAG: MYG1 family protein [Desulfobacterales bacterium]|nr:MYG1 family protein [Desulfobacterales bacterium]MDD4072623.1 MYG1 family protein [Desulfobacterales bacterium]MDD4393992.1 MYG1 family protein [Desulfobacterales bacterium]